MTSHTVGTAFLKALGNPSADPIVLEANETMIGRDPSCQIVLANEGGVSRRHAAIYHRGQQYSIADLGSSNGTFVNDQRIQAEQILRAGDRIQLGSQGPQFTFILPPVDNTVPATQGSTPNNNVAPTIIRPPIAQPQIQPPVQQSYTPEVSSSSNAPKWGLIIGSLCVGGVILFTLLGLGSRVRSILAGSNPSTPTQQPATTNPRPSQAPTGSQSEPQNNPRSPQTTATSGVESSFICESTTDQPCTRNSNNLTSDSSISYTVFYNPPLDAPTQYHASIRFTSSQGEQRRVDLGSQTAQTRYRSYTVPLRKPNGGWRSGTFEITLDARNSSGTITQTQTFTIP
ncbi:FHA domain-containing protein [Pseudanabaenaceae cyanobacterium LEGE 13415]|nr:FHA domain-containing protein [Pseudanabaenaceae cyanobacterium LEGE 13415]